MDIIPDAYFYVYMLAPVVAVVLAWFIIRYMRVNKKIRLPTVRRIILIMSVISFMLLLMATSYIAWEGTTTQKALFWMFVACMVILPPLTYLCMSFKPKFGKDIIGNTLDYIVLFTSFLSIFALML